MQALLFDAPRPHARPLAPRRVVPAEGTWVDHQPGWVQGHGTLFRELARGLRWHEASRPMYERVVAVPRLLASLPDDGAPPLLTELAQALSAQYRPIRHIHLAWYRDGRHSVAMHADHVGERHVADSVVCILSLGEPRPFLLKPRAGGPSLRWKLGWGDLLVMGGRCQADFQHGVPKVAAALPRMSIMFRERRES